MYALIGIVFSLIVFTWSVLVSAGTMPVFWEPAALLLVLGFDIGALLVSGGFRSFFLGVRAAASGGSGAGSSELQDAAETFGLLARCSLGGGFIGAVTGSVLVLLKISDPMTIGKPLGVAVLSVLYGFMFAFFVFYPIRTYLINQANK